MTGGVQAHCPGWFVIAMQYGFERPAADIDYIDTVPGDATAVLQVVAGNGSELHRTHGP